MPILIDGNNLMHRLPKGERSRASVRRMTLEKARRENMRVLLVFDGPAPDGTPTREDLGRLTVLYSEAASADEVILKHLPRGPTARDWTVVTDDRGLGRRVTATGARLRSLGAWCNKKTAPRRYSVVPEAKLSSRDVAEWESFFAQTENSERDS